MGRKNSAKRRFRKNSQGDGGNSPQQEKPGPPPDSEGFPSSDKSRTSPLGKSPQTDTAESSADSSSLHNPSSKASPEGGEPSCPESVTQLDDFQDASSSVTAESAAGGGADMEDDEIFYRVERKTETPESKRRSLKVSHSEVKFYTKSVALKPKQGPEGDPQDFRSTLKTTKEEAKDKATTETDWRQSKKLKDETKPAAGRIADRISLFERPADGVSKLTFKTPRSADVSPVRKGPEEPKVNLSSPDLRSRSAERFGTGRSSSASPTKDKPMTIKERMKNFTEAPKAREKPALPRKPAMTGMPQKPAVSAPSKSRELDRQGKPDSVEHKQAEAKTTITPKLDGQDSTDAGVKISTADSKTKDAPVKSDQGTDPAASAKGPEDSKDLTINLSPRSKGRTGSRSKRRKSKEPLSPMSPNSENKSDHFKTETEPAAPKPEQVDGPETTSASTDVFDQEQTADKLSDFKQKSEKQTDSPFKKEKTEKPGGEPRGSAEPDTAGTHSGETKTPVDKDSVILARKEEKEKGSFTQEEKKETSASSSSSSSSSPAAEKPAQKTPVKDQETPAEHPKVNKDSPKKPERENKGKVKGISQEEAGQKDPTKNQDMVRIRPAERRDAGKVEKVEREKPNRAERKETDKSEKVENEKALRPEKREKEKAELHLDKSPKTSVVSEGGQGVPKTDGAVVRKEDRKDKTQETTKPETNQQDVASESTRKTSSEGPVQTQHERQNKSTRPQKGDGGAIIAHSTEAANGSTSQTETEQKTENTRAGNTEPKAGSVSVENTEISADDSCAHGANDPRLSSPKLITRAAVKEVSVKARNDPPALITAQADNTAETETAPNNPTPISDHKSAERERGPPGRAAKLEPSEGDISGDNGKVSSTGRELKEPKKTERPGGVTEMSLNNSSVTVLQGTAEKTASPVANGDITPHPPSSSVTKKPSPAPKSPASQEVKKPDQDSIQRSPMKKLHLPRGLSRDASGTSADQDSPSSWLDVDLPKRRLKVSMPKLTSAGSESNLLDTPDDLDDNDFIDRIKKLCAPFSLPPRRHNPYGPPQPPFVMPAIKEDRFEKTFEEFKFGLSKKKQFTLDTPSSTLAKLQNPEEKSSPKPARASLADRSLLLSSMDTHSRLREKTPAKEDEDAKEDKEDQIKRKSRLEGSCVLSSLSSSIYRGKRTGLQTPAEESHSGDVSPSGSPGISPPFSSQPLPPSLTAPLKDTVAKQSNKEEAQAGEAVVSDSGPPLPSFNDIKLPDYLEKYLPREPKSDPGKQGQEETRTEATEKMRVSAAEVDGAVKPAPHFPGIPPPTHSTLPELQSQGILTNTIKTARGFHKRPGKMVLFEKAQFSGQAFEIYRDVADATSLKLSPLISVKVVRGCWILYEKPDFQGRCIALEEGGLELANVWAEPVPGTEPQNGPPMLIGSIRLAVWDYSLPHIDLFTEPEGRGRVTPYHDDAVETGSFGIPLSTASIQVHSGVWLIFSDPGFQGMVAVLETGVYPFPETWGFSSPFVGSIRPLKIGGFKVENPSEVKAVLFEKPGFEGSSVEVDGEVFSFGDGDDGENSEPKTLKSVGSFRIIGGLWVGYSHPGFEGQQYVLEEGEYLDCRDWGGSEKLLSLRPILADFMSPHLKMFSDRNFGDLGVNINLTVPVINMDDTGYGTKTQSVDVISGVWVVFEEPGFCGESYILEKGLYGCPEDWGAMQPRVASAMPVVLDDFESAAKFKVQLFSDPGFQGPVLAMEDSVASLPDGFSVASCKVLAGSWLAFEGQDFSGRMYVLEVGSYPDLRAMGCFNTSSSILSLQPAGFEFSLPSITVFERCGLRGKRVVLTDGSVNLQLAGGCSRVQSVLVEGGMWVLYEEINYRGAQVLLKPGEIPDLRQFCSWRKIGSLRPLLQKQVHFRVRNRQTGLMMSLTGDLDDVKLMRVQETEENDGFEQIWFYQNGHLHCKLLEECCLSPSGSVTIAGSRVGLSPEPQNQVHLWSITPEGFIRYTPTADLVLEVKGGHNYDKNQVILNTLDPNKLHQRWDVEII
ncbi:beta/gamma crystallin domain-containing protein 1-like [Xyrichtys novacula]|nr:beta/gamma crystallin domain-containing protein 1-like [Xyrichtys novacula]